MTITTKALFGTDASGKGVVVAYDSAGFTDEQMAEKFDLAAKQCQAYAEDHRRAALDRFAFTCRLCGTELAPGTVGDLCASHAEIEARLAQCSKSSGPYPNPGPCPPAPAVTGIEPADYATSESECKAMADRILAQMGPELRFASDKVTHEFSQRALERILERSILGDGCRCGPEFVKLPSGKVVQVAHVVHISQFDEDTGGAWVQMSQGGLMLDAADYAKLCEVMGV